jgi:hypothetical protein
MSFEQPKLQNSDKPESDKEQDSLYPDLASFIRDNKTIACPAEEIDPKDATRLKDEIGAFASRDGMYYFVDGTGNVATLKINQLDYKDIKSLNGLEGIRSIDRELTGIGFKLPHNHAEFMDMILKAVTKHDNKISREKKEDFNF